MFTIDEGILLSGLSGFCARAVEKGFSSHFAETRSAALTKLLPKCVKNISYGSQKSAGN